MMRGAPNILRDIGPGREHLNRIFDRAQREAEEYLAKLATLRERAEAQTDENSDTAPLMTIADGLRENARTLHWGLQYFRPLREGKP